VWGRQAETCNQYLAKGRKVLVEGRLNPDKETGGPRIWTDQNGKARASYEVNAFEVQFMDSVNGSNGNGNGNGRAAGIEEIEEMDEIPF
jgi:single-strand DNA-binding protein